MKITKVSNKLDLFLVQSQDGKWLRAKKHYNARSGDFDIKGSWTENINEAKLYQKIGPARSQVTFWTKNYPKFGEPIIIRVVDFVFEPVNEGNRTAKAVLNSKIKEIDSELTSEQWELERHMKTVRQLNGDGKDKKTIAIKGKIEKLKKELELLKTKK